MTLVARIGSFLTGLFIILGAVIILSLPGEGLHIVAALVSVSLIVSGIRELLYYVTMAHHMVGGKSILVVSLIRLDFGVFAVSLADGPTIWVLLYLVVLFAVSGVIRLLRGLENRKLQSGWRWTVARGIVDLVFAALSLVFMNYPFLAAVFFSCGLVYSGFTHIRDAFRKTAIVYVS